MTRAPNDGGDVRWTRLLPLQDALLLFGYQTNAQGQVAVMHHHRFDAAGELVALPKADPLTHVFVGDTLPLPGGDGIVRGVDVTAAPLRSVALEVLPDGSSVPMAVIAAETVEDLSLSGANILALTLAGVAHPLPVPAAGYDARVLVEPSAGALTERLRFTLAVRPRCVAFWKGALYIGTEDGAVLRATGAP